MSLYQTPGVEVVVNEHKSSVRIEADNRGEEVVPTDLRVIPLWTNPPQSPIRIGRELSMHTVLLL